MPTPRFAPIVAVVTAALIGASVVPAMAAKADTTPIPLAVSIDPSAPGATFPSDLLGLSIEAGTLATNQTDGRYGNLAGQLASLGAPVLRFGGDSVETTQWAPSENPPGQLASWATVAIGPADLQRLDTLVLASNAKVILGVGLGHYDPNAAASEALAARAALGDRLLAVEVGNEPNNYVSRNLRSSGYGAADYQNEFNAYQSAIDAAVPGLTVTGSSSYAGTWLNNFSTNGTPNPIITQHIYPQNACQGPTPTITTMLSRNSAKGESGQLATGLAVAANNRGQLRVDETNNVICSGQPGVSDRFASALWAADYLSMAASMGVAGINLHTGSLQQCGPGTSPAYAVLCAASAGDLAGNVETPQPEWWGLQLLRPLEGSAFIPTSYSTKEDVVVRAAKDASGVVRVLVDNMDANGVNDSAVSLKLPVGYRVATTQRLQASSLTSTGPVSFGGSELSGGVNGSFAIDVPAASAALVTITTASVTPTMAVRTSPGASSALGAPVTLTANVNGLNAAPPSGLVAFTSGGAAVSGCTSVPTVAITGAAATATCVTRSLPSGKRVIGAAYLGDNTYVSAQASVSGLTIGSQALKLTTQRMQLGDASATLNYAVSPHGTASVQVTMTASAKGRHTVSATTRSSSGVLKLSHLVDNVKYAFTTTVTATTGQLFADTLYGTPLHLPAMTLRTAAARVGSGRPAYLSGTVINGKRAVAGQLVLLYATVGTKTVIQGRVNTDRLGRFSFTERPHRTTTYSVQATFGSAGRQAVGTARPVRVAV